MRDFRQNIINFKKNNSKSTLKNEATKRRLLCTVKNVELK